MPVVEPLPARARFDPARLGAWAVAALLEEVRLTPKPALVDQRGSGAHHDLDLALMTRSAHALGPTFEALAAVSSGAVVSQALRERLGRLGRTGERTMLAATGGSRSAPVDLPLWARTIKRAVRHERLLAIKTVVRYARYFRQIRN